MTGAGIKGLSDVEVRSSKEKYGDNSLTGGKSRGFFSRLWSSFSDPIIKILLCALLINIVFSGKNTNWFESIGIVIAIFLATVVSTASEYGSELAFAKLRDREAGSMCRVVRNGIAVNIPVCDLVVGDVVLLSVGEKIYADGVIISGRISVDQSALNGESAEIQKRAAPSSGKWELSSESEVFRGSIVSSGEAVMRVGRVGAGTYYGKIASELQTETRSSPLKIRLSRLAGDISKIGYIMAALVAAAYLFNVFVIDSDFSKAVMLERLSNTSFLLSSLFHALTLMITVIVVAVPEGLPMMITVVLSSNMRRMLRDNVLVKKLVGIETAGSMNILFTDKTGTLTVGRPEVEEMIFAERSVRTLAQASDCGEAYRMMRLCSTYNNESVWNGSEAVGGNITDRAICSFFRAVPAEGYRVKSRENFDSVKKYSSVP